jgi:hypothetical protein
MQNPTPNKFNEKFREALAQLNPEQLAAVNKMDGLAFGCIEMGTTVKTEK